MSNKPTPKQISLVMSELGRRNKGKPKKLTPAAIAQRRKAGRASARLRKERKQWNRAWNAKVAELHRKHSPAARHTPANIAPLAQTK